MSYRGGNLLSARFFGAGVCFYSSSTNAINIPPSPPITKAILASSIPAMIAMQDAVTISQLIHDQF